MALAAGRQAAPLQSAGVLLGGAALPSMACLTNAALQTPWDLSQLATDRISSSMPSACSTSQISGGPARSQRAGAWIVQAGRAFVGSIQMPGSYQCHKDSSGLLGSATGALRHYAVNNKPDVTYVRGVEPRADSYATEPTNYVQLLACIKHAGSLQRLHHLVSSYADVFDAVHVAAAVAVMPKLLQYRPQDLQRSDSPITGAGVAPVRPRPGAQLREGHRQMGAQVAAMLDALLPGALPRFYPRQIAATVWAYGQLASHGVAPAPAFTSLEHLLITLKQGDFALLNVHGNAVDYAQLLKGLANLGCSDASLVSNLAALVARHINKFKARELQMVARGLAVLGHTEPATYAALSQQALKNAPFFTPEGIATLSWAFSQAGVADAPLLTGLAAGLAPQATLIAPSDVAKLLSSYGRLQVSPGPETLALLGDSAAAMLGSFTDSGLAATLDGFARLQVHHQGLFDAVSQLIVQEQRATGGLGSPPPVLVKVLRAYATLAPQRSEAAYGGDDTPALQAVLAALAGRTPIMSAQELAGLCGAASKLGQAHEACMAAVAQRAQEVITTFTAPQLLSVLQAYSQLQVAPQFQLAVAAGRHIGDTLSKQNGADPAVLVQCLYECHVQNVIDPEAAQAVLGAVQARGMAVVQGSDALASKALAFAHKMSAGDHPAVAALEASGRKALQQ